MTSRGPNVKQLEIEYFATLASRGGIGPALSVFLDKDRLSALTHEAHTFVEQAIAVVKTSPDNPYGDDDEAIAGELVRRIKERNAEIKKNLVGGKHA